MADALAGKSMRWKIRKLVTYVRLFGPRWTLAKVRSQRHLGKTAAPPGRFDNPACSDSNAPGRSVAIIGCGNFAFSAIAHHLRQENRHFLRATLDVDHARAVSLCSAYGGAYATRDLRDILDDDAVRLVFISSNHASHATYAAACIESGKAVHIEKPHAVSDEQMTVLAQAMHRHASVPVFLGFNRPRSSHFAAAQRAMSQQGGPSMLAWFIVGHVIPEGHWYFAESEGGRVLGNLCHWLDASMQLIGPDRMFPCTLTPSSRPESRDDSALTIDCADGSLISISFSVKSESFEGVREVFSGHRGDCLVLLRDFEETRIHVGARRRLHRTRFRDHGHAANILNSYRRSSQGTAHAGERPDYVLNSGWLAIAARQALETGALVSMTGSTADGASPVTFGPGEAPGRFRSP